MSWFTRFWCEILKPEMVMVSKSDKYQVWRWSGFFLWTDERDRRKSKVLWVVLADLKRHLARAKLSRMKINCENVHGTLLKVWEIFQRYGVYMYLIEFFLFPNIDLEKVQTPYCNWTIDFLRLKSWIGLHIPTFKRSSAPFIDLVLLTMLFYLHGDE